MLTDEKEKALRVILDNHPQCLFDDRDTLQNWNRHLSGDSTDYLSLARLNSAGCSGSLWVESTDRTYNSYLR
jgi:hypothetical protein